MAVYKWQRRRTASFGETWVPFARVELLDKKGTPHLLSLQIDSGAVVSLLRNSVGHLLGLRPKDGERIELSSVGGVGTTAYLHRLQTRFDEHLNIPVIYAIADSESVPNLLGRRDIFDMLAVCFDPQEKQTSLHLPQTR
jgi:hypothetical protein